MSHPYFCHIHNGLYEYSEEVEGCQHETCINYRNSDIPPVVVMGIGSTHPEYGKKQYSKQFDKDMHAYKGARKAGLKPDKVSAKEVERAEQREALTERMKDRA